MISSKEISQLSLPDEIFNLLLQIETHVRVIPMVSVEAAILVPITLVDSVLKSLASCCLNISSLPSAPSLGKDLVQSGAGDLLPFSQVSSFSWL